MAYAIIGKQVIKDSVTKLRVLNLETFTYEDVSISDMDKYDNNIILNGEYNVESPYGVLLYYQSIYDLPIFYRTGGVNTYLYKVVISISENEVEIANITGSIKKVNTNLAIMRLLSLNIHSLIVVTPSGLAGFSYELNGEVKQFYVDDKYITRLYTERITDYGKLVTCYYKNVPCYYFNGKDDKSVSLGAVSGVNKFQLLGLNATSYSKKSIYTNTPQGIDILLGYHGHILNSYAFSNVHILCGIDGLSFLGENMMDIKNPALDELKDRLLFTQPSIAHKIEKDLRINELNEVLHLNLFDFEIPDYTTRILNSSLYFEYSNDTIERNNQYKVREIYIPKNVEYFDNRAFSKESTQVLSDKLKKITCIVENPNIYNNVVLSSLFAKLMFREIRTDGIVEVNLNKLKLCYDSGLFKSLKTQTWGMKCYKGSNKKMTEKLVLNDIISDKGNYAILPSESYIKNRIKNNDEYCLVYFEDTSQFIDSLDVEYKKLQMNLNSIALKINNTDVVSMDAQYYSTLKGMTGNITNAILSYMNFIQSFKVKHGDVDRFNNIIDGFVCLFKESLFLKNKVLSLKSKKHL